MNELGFWSNVARGIYRTPDESRLLRSRLGNSSRYFIALAMAGTLIVAFAAPILELASEWDTVAAVVPIPRSSWKVLLSAAKSPCPYDASSAPGCPANSGFSGLWNSALTRADLGHERRIQARASSEFWIGAEIPALDMRRAAAARANALMLGWFRSTFRIWLDGKLIASGDRRTSEQTVLTIPMTRLLAPQPIQIAIQIVNDAGHPWPDLLTGDRPTLGLMTNEKAAAALTRRSFVDKVRPLGMVLTNFFVAAIFILAWLSAREKQEYFYMSLFGLACAASYLCFVDIVVTALPPHTLFALYIYTQFLKGAFTMFVGFAFSRVRPTAFRIGIPVAFALPAAIIAALPENVALFEFRGLLTTWIVPAFCVVGAAACGLQAAHLQATGRSGSYLPVRIRRLGLFALGILAIGFLSWANGSVVISFTRHNYWFRFIDLALVFLLGLVVFSEYREHELQAGRTPVSEYHRRPVLPEKVAGAMLAADFKNSDPFYRHRAEQGRLDDPMAIWRAQFYGAVMRHGGLVLRRKGDEIAAFFDRDRCPDPAASALAAADDMARTSEMLDLEYRRQGLYPPGARGFHFRGSIVEGEIRPIWEQVGNIREPGWSEAGMVATFVRSSRLLELERQLGREATTVLVLAESLAVRLILARPELESKFAVRAQRLGDKHGNTYDVAAFFPEAVELNLRSAA